MQRMILDKKLKENSIKNSNGNYLPNKNKTQILDNTNNIININNESFNTNKYQITDFLRFAIQCMCRSANKVDCSL